VPVVTDANVIDAILRRLADELSLPYDERRTAALPCRAGQLFKVGFGDRLFALKVYDEGYFNDLYLRRALAGTAVPIPAIRACDDTGGELGRPWALMDWVTGNGRISDARDLGKQVGLILRAIHAIATDGAGARGSNDWQYPDWHTLVEVEATRDRVEISGLDDSASNKAFYLRLVDEFVRFGRRQENRSWLLHGDLGLDNLIIDDNRVVGVLDAGWFVGGHPLLDLSYVLNSRLGEGDGLAGLVDGYGIPGLDAQPDVQMLRLYHLIGKLIHFATTGQWDKYLQRRQVMMDFAARHGFAVEISSRGR
jgi:aminoglycoside phosphotransferase (APT) family kinase protein